MSDIAIEFDRVSKKFMKGEKNDSLRDLIPYLSKKLFSGNNSESLQEREFWAVDDVSFHVKYGETLGIIGPNGAGKSTVLKLLSGIMRPNKGKIIVNGRLSALIEVGAGFHPDLTGRENIYLNGAILGMKKEEIRDKFDSIVEFSELEEFIDTPVKRYSSGMFARLGFSVAAHVDPQILLVDEVLSVGDFSFQRKCLQRMQEIASGGTSVIYISHNIPSVISLCPQAILLNNGKVERDGRSDDVCRYYYKAYSKTRRASDDEQLAMHSVDIYSEQGALSTTFKTGDWVTIKTSIESNADLEDLVMGFFIKRNDGLIVFDANSANMAKRNFSFHKGERREIALKFRNNLPEGTYFVGIHFMKEGEGFHYYDDELIEIYVNAPKTNGSAFLDMEW